MKMDAIGDLECPLRIKNEKCRGDFKVLPFLQRGDEILQGLLVCQRCNMGHPILQGIPIFFNPNSQWNDLEPSRDNLTNILACIGGVDKLPETLSAYFSARLPSDALEGIAAKPQKFLTDSISNYMLIHYGKPDRVSHAPLFNPFLELYKKKNIVQILRSWTSTMRLNGKKCLDAGCSVGGITDFLAKRCGVAYGLDINFRSLSAASRITKRIPRKLDRFRVLENGKFTRAIKLNVGRSRNLDFFAGSIHSLPFKDETFDLIVATGMAIDPVEKILTEVSRTLKPKGEVCLTVSPSWNKFGKHQKPITTEAVRKFSKEIEFYREIKDVPYLLREDEHNYFIYSFHVLLGKKIA